MSYPSPFHDVGGQLFDFDTDAVGGGGPKKPLIRIAVGRDFADHYSRMTLLVRRQPRWAIVY